MGAKLQGAELTQARWLVMPRTLSFVLNGDDVLLIKRGADRRVFPNKYNGLGGHVERDEDPATSALREIEEESGLRPHSLRLRGLHNIDAGGATGILLFVYTAISETRKVRDDCPEGTLEWVGRDRVFKLDLVEDLPELLARIFAMSDDEPPAHAQVHYDQADSIVLRFHGDGGR